MHHIDYQSVPLQVGDGAPLIKVGVLLDRAKRGRAAESGRHVGRQRTRKHFRRPSRTASRRPGAATGDENPRKTLSEAARPDDAAN